ncbi:MAG: hypothetical protein ACLT8E_04825 [Akkermansia sp.]
MDGGKASSTTITTSATRVTAVGSWVYSRGMPDHVRLRRAYGIGLPLTKLISHRFKLDEITEAWKRTSR